MTDEEKAVHKKITNAYRLANPEPYREAARKYYHANKEKSKLRNAKWRAANKDYIREKQREDKRLRKLKAVEYLGGRCNRCGNDWHPAIYEFHHNDPAQKERDPSKMLSLSWKRLSTELDKCTLLCANCHRLTHYEEIY